MEQFIKEFLVDKALVLVPVLWVIGRILKNTPVIPDWIIPYALLLAGVTGGLITVGFSADGLVQGALASGLALLAHQLVKQGKEGLGGDI